MYNKKFRLISLFLVFTFLLWAIPAFADDNNQLKVSRISENDRYITSLEVSRTGFRKSDYAIIASGENYPDALVGGVLAGKLDAPLLVTSRDSVSDELLYELKRLDVKKVYMLGGINTLSDNVLKTLAPFNAERLAGSDRYKTAEVVAQLVEKLILDDDKDNDDIGVFYADGRNYPDALAAAPYIDEASGILLLSDGKPINDDAVAIGGASSVPGDVHSIAGIDRYDTAVKIAEKYEDFDRIILVDGTNYPDALSAAGFTADKDAAILLTTPKTLPKVTENFIKNSKANEIIIIGGYGSVSEEIETYLKSLTK